jgi:LysR family transcriptional regulator, glycine cleavage system transcriptional activator
MRRLPPLNALKAFEAAARHVSFTKAANELHVTHGAVSRQVALLEDWLGTALFQRVKSQLVLTDAGKTLLADIGPVFDRIALCAQSLAKEANRETLVINAPPTFTMRWLIPRLSNFQRAHPRIDIRITTSLEPIDFSRGQYDIAIRGTPEPLKGFAASPFLKECITPVCHPDLREQAPLQTAMDVGGHTLISYSTEPYRWQDWLQANGCRDVRPVNAINFEQMYFALQAAQEGLGLALIPYFLVADDIAAGRLYAPFGTIGARNRHYYAYYPEAKVSWSAIETFCAWLRREGEETRRFCDELLGPGGEPGPAAPRPAKRMRASP